ncbi:MAG: hypothetical protein JWN62_2418 [Acidimicrobiales bacterium]|nr:hypothetical protein [Acidimicrobiales bacterium]
MRTPGVTTHPRRFGHGVRLISLTVLAGTFVASCSSDASTRATDAPTSTVAASASSAATTAPTDPVTASSPATEASTTDSTADSPPSTTTTDTASDTTAAPATTAAETTTVPVTAPPVPAGVTLRIGDQLDYLKTVLGEAGQDQDFPYTVDYAAFVGGPPMLQAFQGGALDAGFIGTTPLIFAQSAGLDLVGIAGWASSKQGGYGLVTAPGHDDISGWADLKGKTVAFQKGTAGEAVLLEALDAVGLTEDDINVVDVPQISVTATLEGGSADAGIQTEPLTSAYLANDPTAKLVIKAAALPDRTSVLISTTEALTDAGKSAALADYITRLVRAFAYLRDHQDLIAQGVYVKTYGLTPERAAELVAENGVTNFFQIPGDLLEPQQHLADLFAKSGQIPSTVDVSASFDPRFNALVAATQGS